MTLSLGFVLRAILHNHNNMLDVIPSRLFIFVILFGSLCSPVFIQEMNYNNADSIVPSRALVNEGLLGYWVYSDFPCSFHFHCSFCCVSQVLCLTDGQLSLVCPPPQVTVGSPMKVAVMLSQLPQFESGTILLAHVSLLMYFLISLPLYSLKAVMITTDLLNEFSSWKEFECLRCFVVVFALPLHHSPKYEADFCWWCRGQKETCCLITQPRRGSSFSTNWFLLSWCICRMWSLSSRPLQSMSPNLASGEGLSGLEIRACGKVWHETMELKVSTFLQFCFPLHSEMDSSTVDVQHFSSGSLW